MVPTDSMIWKEFQLLFFFFNSISLFNFCVYVCGCMCAMAFLWRSEDNCRGQFFPSPMCVLGIRLGSKYPHLLSHLTAPPPNFNCS